MIGPQRPVHYCEAYTPGATFEAGSVTVSAADVIAFARLYDPQALHTDPDAASRTAYDGLIHPSSLVR